MCKESHEDARIRRFFACYDEHTTTDESTCNAMAHMLNICTLKREEMQGKKEAEF